MRSYPDDPGDPDRKFRRSFDCLRSYTVHLLGAELPVRGLAFQQQDVGVSACATTAIWSALQKVRDHEDIAAVTPAQITALASRYSLPFGRAMPSEGLSLDQMCQTIQAVGISPSLYRVGRIEEARGYLYSAIKSGFAPVLILKKGNGSHAVAVAGMKLRHPHIPSLLLPDTDDIAGDLIGLYIHDDRRGPYLRASLEAKEDVPHVVVPAPNGTASEEEAWTLSRLPFNRRKVQHQRNDFRLVAGVCRGRMNGQRNSQAVDQQRMFRPFFSAVDGTRTCRFSSPEGTNDHTIHDHRFRVQLILLMQKPKQMGMQTVPDAHFFPVAQAAVGRAARTAQLPW